MNKTVTFNVTGMVKRDGEGAKGPWVMYKLYDNDTEYVVFKNQWNEEQLANLKEGDSVNIQIVQKGEKTYHNLVSDKKAEAGKEMQDLADYIRAIDVRLKRVEKSLENKDVRKEKIQEEVVEEDEEIPF